MFNLFKKPLEKDTVDDWAKLALDIAKVAILAIPVILYGGSELSVKMVNLGLLIFFTYGTLRLARKLRAIKEGA